MQLARLIGPAEADVLARGLCESIGDAEPVVEEHVNGVIALCGAAGWGLDVERRVLLRVLIRVLGRFRAQWPAFGHRSVLGACCRSQWLSSILYLKKNTIHICEKVCRQLMGILEFLRYAFVRSMAMCVTIGEFTPGVLKLLWWFDGVGVVVAEYSLSIGFVKCRVSLSIDLSGARQPSTIDDAEMLSLGRTDEVCTNSTVKADEATSARCRHSQQKSIRDLSVPEHAIPMDHAIA